MHYMKIKWREFPMVIGRRRRREHPQPTFCTTTLVRRKNAGEKVGHAQNILPVRFSSGHVTLSKGPTRADIAHVHNILPDSARD